MASTGLLTGVNPYKGGNMAVDFVSKPTQYAIQELQHQQAKAEATEKYYKDWEKSLNTAGIGEDERRMFTEKLNQLKGYGIKNKEQINNPSKYGYDAQSTLEAGFKELSNYLEGAKQKTAQNKAYKTIIDQHRAQGKLIDGDMEVWKEASLPYGAGYVAPELSRIKIYDAHDPAKYQQSIYSKVKTSELPGEKSWNKSLGDYQLKVTKDIPKDQFGKIDKDALNQIEFLSNGEYDKDIDLQKKLQKISEDPEQVKKLSDIYQSTTGKPMPNSIKSGLNVAYTLALKPAAQVDFQKYEDWRQREDYKINRENEQVRGNFKGALADLIKASEKNPRVVYNSDTGKNETWTTLPLTDDVTKNFKVPYVEKSYVKNTDYDPSVPNSEEFIIKPGTKTVQKQVDYVLKAPNGDFFGYVQPVDDKGNKIPGKFEKVPITKKDLAKALVKDYVSEKNLSTAVDAALEGLGSENPSATSNKKQIKSSEVASKAAASGYSEKEYRQLLKANGVKIID